MKEYNWQRFWFPRGKEPDLSDKGFLVDPNSKSTGFYNPECYSLEDLLHIPCLILLGEPGIGKTNTLEKAKDEIYKSENEKGNKIIWMDLRSYGDENRLISDLFESSDFISCKKGDYKLSIFLDSFDECLIHIETLINLFIEKLRGIPTDKIFLRIVCRSGVNWPNSIEEDLKKQYCENNFAVYELAPLRSIDIIEAAKENEINSSEFIDCIVKKDIVPFANKPVTLSILINIFKNGGIDSFDKVSIYEKGCFQLCKEPNERRRYIKIDSLSPVDRLMEIGGQIALIMIFANKTAVFTGNEQDSLRANEDISFDEILAICKEPVLISKSELIEILSNSLFSLCGPNRIRWSHKTYEEFLAAWYMKNEEMPIEQITSLLFYPLDGVDRIIPQLYETAAWIAGMNPEIFKKIAAIEPMVLLKSDFSLINDDNKKSLVEILLEKYNKKELFDTDWSIHKYYHKLFYPDIQNQLRLYINNQKKDVSARRIAIDIAKECNLESLQDDLLKIALNPKETIDLRVKASYGIFEIGNNENKLKLKPLAEGKAGDDPEDELKGCGLMALWPDQITIEELLKFATPPQNDSFFGTYHLFLFDRFINSIKIDDLPKVLNHFEELRLVKNEYASYLVQIIDELIEKAWYNFDKPELLNGFAKFAINRLKRFEDIFSGRIGYYHENLLNGDENKRKILLEAIINILDEPEKNYFKLVDHYPNLIKNDDLPWLYKKLQNENAEEKKKIWALIISRVFDSRVPGQVDYIIDLCQKNKYLSDAFNWLLKPVEINSPEALKMKEDYFQYQKLINKKSQPIEPEIPLKQKINFFLEKCELENIDYWWAFYRELISERKGSTTHYHPEMVFSDLLKFDDLNEDVKSRIRVNALNYISNKDPQTSSWFETNDFHFPAVAGYHALLLIMEKYRDYLIQIPVEVWKKWAHAIIKYSDPFGPKKYYKHQELVKYAYEKTPDEIIESLIKLIDFENNKNISVSIMPKIELCWDQKIKEYMLKKVKDKKLNAINIGFILDGLLDHNVEEAKKFAESLIKLHLFSNKPKRDKSKIAALSLINHTDNADWVTIWPIIKKDRKFGMDIIASLANGHDSREMRLKERLNEDQLADVFIWLVRQYPPEKDPKMSGSHKMDSRENIAFFRDSLLRELNNRSSLKTLENIKKIHQKFPKNDYIKWLLTESEKSTLRNIWKQPQPSEIIKMINDNQVRMVQNGDQLISIVIESLKRLEIELQGETPAAIFLWNQCLKGRKKVSVPKDENALSDYIKRYLDVDLKIKGIIANREPEIRGSTGKGKGEILDIIVDTFIKGKNEKSSDTISVYIEVKGCWHLEVNTAMESQLVDRYLKDNTTKYGIYIVGWYNCLKCDKKQCRNKKHFKDLSKDKLQKIFDGQAIKLSKNGLIIKSFVLNVSLR